MVVMGICKILYDKPLSDVPGSIYQKSIPAIVFKKLL